MTTTTDPIDVLEPTTKVKLADGEQVAILVYEEFIGMQARNEECAAFVSMTPAEAARVARELLRASETITPCEPAGLSAIKLMSEAAGLSLEHVASEAGVDLDGLTRAEARRMAAWLGANIGAKA